MSIEKEIQALLAALQAGQTILYPTETVWGLGCDVRQEAAIEAVFDLKQRPKEKNLVLLVDSLERLAEYVAEVPQKAARLVEYYTRPLTIVYEGAKNLPPALIAADGSVAIRVTTDPHCKALIAALGAAIVSTSANLSGQEPPTCLAEVHPDIRAKVGAIAPYRQTEISKRPPSAIVRVQDGEDLVFIRK